MKTSKCCLKAASRVWIKACEQRLLKFRATASCLYPTAEGMPTIYIPTLSQWYPRIYHRSATDGQSERARDENLDPLGILGTCSPAGWGSGGVDRRGPLFGAVLEVLDVYHACCFQRLSDSIHCRWFLQ